MNDGGVAGGPGGMTDDELLALHREIVATPSVSGNEATLCATLVDLLWKRGAMVERIGGSLLALHGDGPTIALCSHLDTVPASSDWTRDPHDVVVEEGRVVGLGSNDAKASVAAMIAAWLRLRRSAPDLRVVLALTAEEETTGKGAESLVAELDRRGMLPEVVLVGEPTGLDLAVAQKGLLVLKLVAKGDGCHAAHASALGARNAIRELARDVLALEDLDFGPGHPTLGPVTVEPTMLEGGTARNRVPAEAACILDVRTNPDTPVEMLVERIGRAVAGEIRVVSDRLRPCGIDPGHPLVAAAQAARPESKVIGSRGLSDLVSFRGIPGIKVGPGRTERSHTPDEYVLESEILEGARFFESAVLRCRSFLAKGVSA